MTFLLPAVASAATSFGLSKLLGGKEEKSAATQFKPTGISAGGLTSSVNGDNLSISSSSDRLGLVNRIAGGYAGEADAISGLRGRVAPGFSDMRRSFSDLRDSRLQEIENARNAAIGNLRENMARRRVQGSSFGQDALARAEAEFSQAKERARAETATQESQTFLQEMEATSQLIQQEFVARRGQFETGLNELNLQADVASKLAAGATAQMGANARLETELAAKEQAAKGKFFGSEIISPISNAVGKGFSNFSLPSFGG